MRSQKFFSIAATTMALAVAFGAFGSHALATVLEQNNRIQTWDTASKYHFYHGLGLFVVGYLYRKTGTRPVFFSFHLMLAGTIIFSGTLYLLSVTGYTVLGAVTPVGGLLLIASWLVLGRSLWVYKKLN